MLCIVCSRSSWWMKWRCCHGQEMWIYFGKLWGKKLLRWSNIGSQVQPDHSKRWKWSDCFCSPSAVLFLLAFFLPLCLISRNTTSAHCLRRYITKSKQQFRPPLASARRCQFFLFYFCTPNTALVLLSWCVIFIQIGIKLWPKESK